jgi:hypothetical protein
MVDLGIGPFALPAAPVPPGATQPGPRWHLNVRLVPALAFAPVCNQFDPTPAITIDGITIYPVKNAFDNGGNLRFTATLDATFTLAGRLCKSRRRESRVEWQRDRRC